MTDARHDALHPLLADYVLGEVDATQRREIDAHVASCAVCSAELRDLEQAFHSIGIAETPEQPPAALRARVLADLARDANAPPAAQPDRTRWTPGFGWFAAAAAVAMVFASLLVLAMMRNTQLAEALSRADATHEEFVKELDANEAQADLAVSILTAGDLRRIDLAPGDTRGPLGRAYFSPTRGLLIVADELPEPPAGRVYQVWLIGSRTNGPVSAGLLTHPRTGRGMLIVPTPPADTGGTITVAITDEPAGGLASPTGAKHLVGSS
jgi:anti-sigma-K factor RskA